MPVLVGAFQSSGGGTVRPSFGASGTLARQITHGAPFDVFLSADESYVRGLVDSGFGVDRGAVYALGRLVLIAPQTGTVSIEAGLPGLAAAIETKAIDRIAIANPNHAPYGVAAKQALAAVGLWDATRNIRVIGENVAQATQFALSGPKHVGLVAASMIETPALKGMIRFQSIAADLHDPIRHRMLLLDSNASVAVAFYDFMSSNEAAQILKAYGFSAPSGAS